MVLSKSLKESFMLKEQNDILLKEYKKAVDESSIFSKTDTNGIITYANSKFCDISGYSQSELVGKPHSIVRHPDMSSNTFAELWETIKNKKIWKGKVKNLKKDGTHYVVQTTIVPVLDENGEIVEYISIRFDITELEKLKKDEIINIKTSSVYKLAGGIAHEINTPITYIKGNVEFIEMYLEDIKEEETKKAIKDSINTIKDGINRVSNIVSAVKELSYDGVCKFDNINIYEVILTACRLGFNRSKRVSPILINKKDFSLDTDSYDFDKVEVNINKHKIKQVILSLINNSLDEFLKQNREYKDNKIEIDLIKKESFILIKVKDNAGGIPSNMLDIIFEPFASNKEFSGLGVGLNIVKSIIDEHDGEIKVYNDNFGAVFEIKLKLIAPSC
jgi:PAS domain S-box-containing protein